MTTLFDIIVKLSIPRYVPSCWNRETVYCTVVNEAQMLAECDGGRLHVLLRVSLVNI